MKRTAWQVELRKRVLRPVAHTRESTDDCVHFLAKVLDSDVYIGMYIDTFVYILATYIQKYTCNYIYTYIYIYISICI